MRAINFWIHAPMTYYMPPTGPLTGIAARDLAAGFA